MADDDMVVLLPSFVASELTRAFEIGFLLYLPFLLIDIVVSNVLMAMGMMMVQPTLISIPLKLLLFVSIDGWSRLMHGLVLSYGG
jgi:type III secretion protein R